MMLYIVCGCIAFCILMCLCLIIWAYKKKNKLDNEVQWKQVHKEQK